jgi:hypothetical protein
MTRQDSKIIFAVGNRVQQENAIAVAEFISEVPVFYLNLWTGTLHNEAPDFDGHSPSVTLGRIGKLALRSPISSQDVTVIPQDVGLLQRALARRAKRTGSLVALMPDGVAAAGANVNGSKGRLLLRSIVDASMRFIRLVDGRAGSMGSSNPHLILSWGTGWDAAFSLATKSEFRHMGCPRMDPYTRIPSPQGPVNLLVCSQPLGIPTWSRPYAAEWYSFLESLLEQGIANCNLRVRLHPAEKNDPSVPASLRESNLEHSLATDLRWASQVASPFSTVLVEALAAGRPFFALSRDEEFRAHASRTPFFADTRIRVSGWTSRDIENTLHKVTDSTALKSDYLCHVGDSARMTANLLVNLAIQPR